MHTRRRRTNAAVSRLTLDTLEPRTLFSVSASLAQLIALNTPHNSHGNPNVTPLLIIPAGTVLPVDATPLQVDLNSVTYTSPTSIQNLIESGFGNGAAWNSTFPVTSSTVTVSGNFTLTSPVIIDNRLLSSGPLLTLSPTPVTGVTVRYTTFGDASLDSQVDYGIVILSSPTPTLDASGSIEDSWLLDSTTLINNGSSSQIVLASLNNTYSGGTLPNASPVDSGVLTFGGAATIANGSITWNGANITSGSLTAITGNASLAGQTLFLKNPTQAASGTLIINGSCPINVSDAGSITSSGISGTYNLVNLNGGFISPTTLLNPISNSTYTFGDNGQYTVTISPSEPLPSDPTTIPTSITDNPAATTQIAIPTTL